MDTFITLNQIAYSILNKIRPNISDDEHIDLREIKYEIHNQRALLIRNELNKNRTIDDDIIQDLGCLELELVDISDCPDELTGCQILRTKKEIPDTIELHNKTGITRVGPINKIDRPFSFVEYNRAIFSGNGTFNKTVIFAFLLNNRVYLTSKYPFINLIEKINVRGVFENPAEVGSFLQTDNTPCYSDDSKYPIKRWMINYLEGYVLEKFLKTEAFNPSDKSNDARFDLKQGINDKQTR